MTEAELSLSGEELRAIVEKKATCPFIGTAVAMGLLPVCHEPANPLASIEVVRRLGNTGGGDLGEILVFFATGNHALMRGRDGRLSEIVPIGRFSLEFPGSQGSHPGHSGILEGDPATLDSGRLSLPDYERLVIRATNGLIKRSDVGRFIADNLRRDPKSKVFGASVAELLARDLEHFVKAAGLDLLEKLHGASEESLSRDLEQKLTKLTGEDNLVGSCGEFGLLFAFLANSPHTQKVDGEPALSLEDVESMFVHKRFPEGWDRWKKTRSDWVTHTMTLMVSAGKAYLSVRA
jgi:hypothetical protein